MGMMATRNESAELRSRRRKQRRRKDRRINPHKERGGHDSEEILDAYQEVKLDGELEKLKKEMRIKTPRKREGPANEEPADDYQQANLDGELAGASVGPLTGVNVDPCRLCQLQEK